MSPTSPRDPSSRPPPLGVRFGRWIATLGLTPAEHHVALAMVIYANGDGAGIRPRVERIATETGLSESTVKRALHGGAKGGDGIRRPAGLLARGVFVQVDSGGGREPGSADRGRPAEYQVNPVMVRGYPSSNPVTVTPYRPDTRSHTRSNGPGYPVTVTPEEVGRGLEEEDARAGAPEAPRATEVDPMAMAEAWHYVRDPASPPYVRKAGRRTIIRGGEGDQLEREEASR